MRPGCGWGGSTLPCLERGEGRRAGDEGHRTPRPRAEYGDGTHSVGLTDTKSSRDRRASQGLGPHDTQEMNTENPCPHSPGIVC